MDIVLFLSNLSIIYNTIERMVDEQLEMGNRPKKYCRLLKRWLWQSSFAL